MKNISRFVMASACFVLAAGLITMVAQMLYWSLSGGSVGKSIGTVVWALIALPAVIYISMRGWRALRGQEVLTPLDFDPKRPEPIKTTTANDLHAD